jgi:hypothetical protein
MARETSRIVQEQRDTISRGLTFFVEGCVVGHQGIIANKVRDFTLDPEIGLVHAAIIPGLPAITQEGVAETVKGLDVK